MGRYEVKKQEFIRSSVDQRKRMLKKTNAGLVLTMGLGLFAGTAWGGELHELTADSQTFTAYFEEFDGGQWLLIARGRNNWEMDTDGQGSVDDVSQNLKTTSAFTPAVYSDAIVNDLLSQAGLTFPLDVTVRVSRATSTDGASTYQDSRWTGLSGTSFTFDFDSTLSVTHEIKNAGDTPVNDDAYAATTPRASDTYDNFQEGAGDTGGRIFTWLYSGVQGFRYGSQVGSSTAADSFLYGSSHPAAYTEIYIAYPMPSDAPITFADLTASDLTTTSVTFNAMLEVPSTNADVYVHWGPTDGTNNPAAWTNSAPLGAWVNVASTNISFSADGLSVGSLYYYTFRGSNAATNVWASPSASFTTVSAPAVDNNVGATEVRVSSATMNGVLTAGSLAEATICWGVDIPGTPDSLGAWDHAVPLGQVGQGVPFSVSVTGLSPQTTYHYRGYVSNEVSTAWSTITNFTTVGPAGNLYWDGGTNDIPTDGDGASGGGSGTWDTTLRNWDAGAAPHVVWNNYQDDTAVFDGTAGTVTLGTDIIAGGLTFNASNYVLTGNALHFHSTGLISNDVIASIDSSITGTLGVVKSGVGELVLGGNNTHSGGTTLRQGRLSIGAGENLGAAGSPVIFDGQATLFNRVNGAVDLGSRPLVVNSGAVGSFELDSGDSFLSSGTLSGDGVIAKSGAGTLRLTGANTYSGGTTLEAGVVDITSDSSLGAADSALTFDGSATLWNNVSGSIDLGARPIALNNAAIGTFKLGRGNSFSTTGAVSGDGGVSVDAGGGNVSYLRLLSASNSFTGPISLSGGNSILRVELNSLVDSTNAITFVGGNATLTYLGDEVLVLNNRPIALGANGTIDNSSANAMTLNGPVTVSGTGNRTLGLAGSGGGSVNSDLDQGAATLYLSTSGNWSLAGSNTYSGVTTLNSGTLQILGAPALPTNTTIILKRSTTLSIRTDEAGSVNLGNPFGVAPIDTSSGVISQHSIDVRNNGGGTTGSTIVLGTVDLASGDMRANRQINVTGGNGYILQVGDVRMSPALRGTAAGGPNRFNPSSASIIIAGTVKQLSGDTGASSTDNTLYLGGVMTGNLVSGTIADADDYTSGSNVNANALNVYKGDSGDWTLSGVNTYSGLTTINAGLLRVTGSLSASGSVTVANSGAVIGYLGGTGTVGAVKLDGTGSIALRDGGVGTLTIDGDLNINGTANAIGFDLGTGANGTDKITVDGNVTVTTPGAGVISVNQLSGILLDAGTYDLITATGTMASASDFTLNATSAFGNTFALQRDGTSKILQLVVIAAPSAPSVAFWTGGSDTNWSTATNWATDITGDTLLSAAPGFDSDVSFYATGAVRLTTGIVDTDIDINSLTYVTNATANTTIGSALQTLTFEAASGTGITVNTPMSGSPIHTIATKTALASSQTWTVNSNAALTVSGVVSDFGAGNALTKDGAGTLTLSGINTYSGATVVDGGTLAMSHFSLGNVTVPNALGLSSAAPANLLLGNGATLKLLVTGDSYKSTDRRFTINGTTSGDSATIDSSGTGNRGVGFTSTASPAYGTPDQTRTLILGGTQASGGNTRNFNNKLYANIADNGSGAVSLTKIGVGSWQPRGNNTYTGTTTVNGGILRLISANALPGGLGVTGGVSGLTLDDGVVELEHGDFRRNLGTGSDQFQIPGGVSGFGALAAARNVVINDDPNTELVWGSATFNPSTFVLNSGTATATLTFSNKIDLAGNTGGIAVYGNTAYIPSVIRSSSGTGGLIKSGNGTLVLSATNTYSGATTIEAGTLEIDGAGVLGGGAYAASITNTATLRYKSSADQVLSGVISGTGALIKDSASALTLSGQNTYSGATTIQGGTVWGVTGGGASNSAVTVANTPGNVVALGIRVTNNTQTWACASLTFNTNGVGAELQFDFDTVPSPSVPPLSIAGDLIFNGAPQIAVETTHTRGTYPLLTVGGTAPSVVPALRLSGSDGGLAQLFWGGVDNKTLYVQGVSGVILIVR
jgi:fibronectin-binding autotransporter adhesin